MYRRAERTQHPRHRSERARRNTPCVVFLDEIDALGQKRTKPRGRRCGTRWCSCWRRPRRHQRRQRRPVRAGQATNQPWDIDPAIAPSGAIRSDGARGAARHGSAGADLQPHLRGPPRRCGRSQRARAADRSVLGRGHSAGVRHRGRVSRSRIRCRRDARRDHAQGSRAGRRDGRAEHDAVVRRRTQLRDVRESERRIRQAVRVHAIEQTVVMEEPRQGAGSRRRCWRSIATKAARVRCRGRLLPSTGGLPVAGDALRASPAGRS